MTWLLPMLARRQTGRKVGTVIVVLPYKFLVAHMVTATQTTLAHLANEFYVTSYGPSDINEHVFPAELSNETNFPNLIFLNLETAGNFFQYYKHSFVRHWVSSGRLLKIYVDELQQLLAEYSFRFEAYARLRMLSQIGCGVVCLSGSLDQLLPNSLMNYLGLHSPSNPLTTISGMDPVGSGFDLHVRGCIDLAKDCLDIVQDKLVSREQAVHVLCTSRDNVRRISSLASSRGIDCIAITSEDGNPLEVAKRWTMGECDVLVSSTCGLTGVDSPICHHVVIAGFLFDISSVVQAFGRLRPGARARNGATVTFLDNTEQLGTGTFLQSMLYDSNDRFRHLLEHGVLEERDKQSYLNLFGGGGLFSWLLGVRSSDTCLLVSISKCFGSLNKLPCKRCSVCLTRLRTKRFLIGEDILATAGSPLNMDKAVGGAVSITQSPTKLPESLLKRVENDRIGIKGNARNPYARKRLELKDDSRMPSPTKKIRSLTTELEEPSNQDRFTLSIEAMAVVNFLSYACPACKASTCDGENCLVDKRACMCYVCGQKHFASQCPVKATIDQIANGKSRFCVKCYDAFGRTSEVVNHCGGKKCPLLRRLKRLFFMTHVAQVTTTSSFQVYLQEKHKSLETFGFYLSFCASFLKL